MNPINQIILEGPDLSGKTTLYQDIHNLTSYRWNIQDRSALSMLVYARLYGRNEFGHLEALKAELNNLNNFIILLLPGWEVLSKRFVSRGDEIQNLISLKKIYNIFNEAASELEGYPNVYVIRKEVDDFILKSIISDLFKFENKEFYKLYNYFFLHALASKKNETLGLALTSYDFGKFDDVKLDYLNYEKEKVYYKNITNSILKKIDDERNGVNEYFSDEDVTSRRFIYTSNTCISLAHFVFRKNILDCKFFIRSSNTKDTLKYDLNFLKYISMKVKESLLLENNVITKMHIVVNSAHILDKI